MSVLLWPLVGYLGIGIVWLVVLLTLVRSLHESVTVREAAVHLLGWPYVLVVLRLWWVVIVAALIFGLVSFAALAAGAK
jgi:hypothetical protein